MRRYLHWIAIVLLLAAAGFDMTVWGAAARLPEVGPLLQRSAQHEAPLTSAYMFAGGLLDAALPSLDEWGQRYATSALGDAFARIKSEPAVAMDLVFGQTFNPHHATLKFCHWAAPVLALLSLIFWLRRPKKVQLMGSRRR